MKFDQLYSSSSGNLYMVTAANGKRLMIECGVTWPKILKALGHDLSDIVGCLLTHEHKDHSKAIRDVMVAGIDVYASEGTIKALGVFGGRKATAIEGGRPYRGLVEDTFSVYPFNINHDAAEPLGFIISHLDENLLFVTDTSHIKQSFSCPFNTIAIECSYNKEYLAKRVKEETINEDLAKRLLTSHMEEKEAMRYLAEFCDLSKCSEIHLLHLSQSNIHAEKIRQEIKSKFFIETVIHEKNTLNAR